MRIMVDAEQSYMQPAIDALVIHLQQVYNREEPVVFNTYQCYLLDTPTRSATCTNTDTWHLRSPGLSASCCLPSARARTQASLQQHAWFCHAF